MRDEFIEFGQGVEPLQMLDGIAQILARLRVRKRLQLLLKEVTFAFVPAGCGFE